MSEENISLLNCDFSQKKPRLTSPLSITAVKLVGATLDDLRFISLDEYLKNNIKNKNLEKDLQIERYKHHENNRINLIKEAKHIREEIIKEQEKENETNINNQSSTLFFSPKYNVNISYNLRSMKKNMSAENLEHNIYNQYNQSIAIKLEKENYIDY